MAERKADGRAGWRRDRYNAWVAAGKPEGGWLRYQASKSTPEPVLSGGSTGEAANRITANLPEGKLSGWPAEDLATVTAAVTLLVLALTAMAAHGARVPELGARHDEAEAIAAPATRILLRHVPVPKGMRGDVADGAALATALIAYCTRIYMTLGDRAREAREIRTNGIYNPAAVPSQPPPTSATGPVWPNANQVEGLAA